MASRQPLNPRSFSALLEAYVNHLRVRGFSKGLREQASHVLPRFFSYLRERQVRSVLAVTEAHVFAYAAELARRKSAKGTPLSGATQRTYLAAIQRLFVFLERRGVILENPALDLTLPTVTKLPRVVLNQTQARRLIEAPPLSTAVGKRNRAILETLYGTGLRVAECAHLELRDLDLSKGVLLVRQGKGKKDRYVPVAGQAAAALELYLREARPELATAPRQQALFVSTQNGRALSAGAIQLMVRQCAELAGLDIVVTPHLLRHSYATHLVQGGADVRHVQRLLGHSWLNSTAIYTRVMPQDLAETMARAHPRERSRRNRKRRTR